MPKPKPQHTGSSAKLEDVAKLAQVSTSTVSRFLSGTIPVSEEKRKAIQAAVDQLNFRPNLLARSLKKGEAMTVGVITHTMASQYFSEVLTGIETELYASGYAPFIVSGHWSEEEEIRRIELLLARRVDGIIILVGQLADKQILKYAQDVPIIAVGRILNTQRTYGFTLDNYTGAVMATQHLIDLGHRRIVFIAGREGQDDAAARFAGYRSTLEKNQIPFDPELVVPGEFRQRIGYDSTMLLLNRGTRFSAIFAANDESAFGARLALYERNIHVPNDVSLIGFDDVPGSSYTTPPLTTIRQPMFAVGTCAARALLQLMRGEKVEVSIPPLTLELRQSTQAPQAK